MKASSRSALVPLVLPLLLATACARHAADPMLSFLATTLEPGDRLVLARALDADAAHVASVVTTKEGKPELRLYDRGTGGSYSKALTLQKGDEFRNLTLEDVDGDGRPEILSTWEGGHLEIVEVTSQGPPYKSLFQNAGRQIEKRYDAAGLLEFWITSRTYDEPPGQPPAYATTVYRFSGGAFVESAAK